MALKVMPGSLAVRNTRGFVYLKLGKPELAVAEYEAALGIDSNRAQSLVGRGLARARLGRTADGEADKDAARAIYPLIDDPSIDEPSIDRQFSAYGLD